MAPCRPRPPYAAPSRSEGSSADGIEPRAKEGRQGASPSGGGRPGTLLISPAGGSGGEVLGLIAGEGAFPIEIARAVRAAGQPVHAVAFAELTDPSLEGQVSSIDWLPLGAVRPLLDSLHGAGAHDVVLAGKVAKTHLHRPGVPVAPDREALALFASLDDRADGRLLSALADLLEAEGFELKPQAEWVPDWIARPGVLGETRPTERQRLDIALGAPIARSIADLDVGQCVAVEAGTVLAVEAIDRTKLDSLRSMLERYPGPCPVTLELNSPGDWSVNLAETGLFVDPSDALLTGLERLFGTKVCELH